MVHGDDFFSTGQSKDLTWLRSVIQRAFETKTKVIGPEKDDEKQVKVLNRTVTYMDNGINYEADPRHAELIIHDMKLSGSKEVATPGVDDEASTPTSEKELDPSRTSRYKSVVARANYLAHDRPEIQYATKECARSM
eukprot:2330777-Karenia_brevis.AAC.1